MMRKILFGFLSCLVLLGGNIFAETWLSAPDVIAGNSTTIKLSGLYANEKLTVKLIRPDKSRIVLQSQADELGFSSFRISSINIQQAGYYDLIISRELGNYPVIGKFKVFPNVVSAYKSKIDLDKSSVAADGEEIVRLTITARDAYGNLIKNIPVKVISSRNNDFIVASGKTDKLGQAVAKISSKTAGVSVITVVLGDTVVFEKKEIVFFLAGKDINNVGAGWDIGKFLKTQLFDDPAEDTSVAYFSIENLPTEASVGENLSAKIVARDENGDQVVNYTGTVRFSSSDDRAILPNDYTFSPSDQGAHDFYLAITFGTAGDQSISVHDLDDFRVSGEQNINIAMDSEAVEVSDDPKLTIDIPVNGSSFNTARVTISGTAVQCSVVKLADGQITLIDNLAVDESNKYVYQTPSLADGTHVFQAFCVDNEDLVSNAVTITIDRTPPQVISVETEPAGPFCGNEDVTLKVGGDDLDTVECIFNEQIFTLSKGESDKFTTTLKIPAKKGEFPIECTVSDLLGNSVTETNAGVVAVDPTICEPPDEEDEAEEEVVEPENIAPTAITNLSAKSGEVEKVTLFWSPATDDKEIKYYQINFAKCSEKDDLNQVNKTPDNRTQWYVTPLEPCETYCFQVTAYDEEGLASPASNIAEGTPYCPEENKTVHTSAPVTPKSGANTIWPAILAIFAGLVMIFWARREG